MSDWLKIINSRKRKFDKINLLVDSKVKKEIGATLEINQTDRQNSTNCLKCNNSLSDSVLTENNGVCCFCNYHYRINSIERIELVFDENSIDFFDEDISNSDPLNFPGYKEKLRYLIENLKIKEAVITGKGRIFNKEVYFGVMDYRFIMGSMGSVVGEKLTRMIEKATKENKPVIIFSASGGARMQEGMISLYQMVKVVAAVENHSQRGLLYINVLTDPTTGGVLASFASIADIIIAEPNATIGFAGKKVIKNTIKEKIPSNFQTSEFHFENGHIDIICHRKNLKNKLLDIIDLYSENKIDKINEIKWEINEIQDITNPTNVNISSWEKVKLSRQINRLNGEDYISKIFDKFIELHGDRISNEDKSIITGIGSINGINVTVILSAKGKSLDENLFRNFGMARPEGYRKVERVSKLSEKFGLPVICFVDTPGAYSGVEAEKMGQGYAIASNIRNFMKLSVPILSIITGEGGSGGALAIGVADWIFILENSIYSVISPEGCASILFKDSKRAKEVSEFLKLTADELLKLNIVDEIIPETKEGIDIDEQVFINNMKMKVFKKLIELLNLDIDTLLFKRGYKFRSKGV